MDECSDASLVSNNEEIRCPGPLFRNILYVLGDCEEKKSRLIQSLIGAAGKKSAASTDVDDKENKAVDVQLWYPFKTTAVNLLDRPITGDEHHLILEVWNLKYKQIYESVYQTCMTPEAVYMIVFDVTSESYKEKLTSSYISLLQKFPGCCIFLVAIENDTSTSSESAILDHLKFARNLHKEKIKDIISELGELIVKVKTSTTDPRCNTPEVETLSHHSCLQQTLEKYQHQQNLYKEINIDRVYLINSINYQGLQELRTAILATVLDRKLFPQLDHSTQTSLTNLYDEILKLRANDVILLPLKKFYDFMSTGAKESKNFEENVYVLNIVGGVLDLRLFGDQEKFICVYPSAFINIITNLLFEDDKASFKFEYRQFWPEDSGYKHPDAELLAKWLAVIPTKGLIREALFPLLWKNYNLVEEQVLYLITVLNCLGVLIPHGTSKCNCEGLAMPDYPSLSVKKCHAVPLLDKLSTVRPQLNWTTKPFKGDIQITWRFEFPAGIPRSFLQQLIGIGQAATSSSSYQYLWNNGVLLKVGEVYLCLENLTSSIDVSFRGNADEIGEESESVQLLWVTAATFLKAITTFLEKWPCLIYKNSIKVFGHQFYFGDKVVVEPMFNVSYFLTCWSHQSPIIFTEDQITKQIDLNAVFPFTGKIDVSSTSSWLDYLIQQQESMTSYKDAINSKYYKTSVSRTTHRNKRSLRMNKKKNAEIKWDLRKTKDADGGSVTDKTTDCTKMDSTKTQRISDTITPSAYNNDTGLEQINLLSNSSTNLSSSNNGVNIINDEECSREINRITSCFVASILASSIAQIIEEDYDNGNSKIISAAQVKAAKITAEAACAAQNGDVDGAAKAVIDAVRSVEHAPDNINNTNQLNSNIRFTKSKTCRLL
ncbi:hypothetical protein SNE40_014961 [Patella caerulea]|uniref:Uncharacterized protein n=1 Tax=Patella caerulea TaxID=87958 RepID=A0AAN8JEN5_PATCE